ncbi:MAG: hypothetical protein MUO70_08480 [Euryarchaeota archaeon]|jgi:uncharacterized protein YwgA|nr:hypothetical protein [Euryarchaeota archaeon]
MTKGRILLKLVLDKIGLGDLPVGTFSKRLMLQKKVYLLQVTGLELGYHYNWYLRGPYCPALTRDAFTLKEELASGEQDYEDYALRQDALLRLRKAEEIWEVRGDISVEPEFWVELLASLHYLKHIAYWPGSNVTTEVVFAKLKEAKPQFADKPDLIERARRKLGEIGLWDHATLM